MTEQTKNNINTNGSSSNAIHQIYLSSQIKNAECRLNKVESIIDEKKKKQQQEEMFQQQQQYMDDDENKQKNQNDKPTSPQSTLRDLSSIHAHLENLSIVHDYIASNNIYNDDDDEFEAAFDNVNNEKDNLQVYVKQYIHIGHVLLHHIPPSPPGSKTTENSSYTMLLTRYKSLHQYVRAVCLKELRTALRLCHYPLPNGCFQIKCALDEMMYAMKNHVVKMGRYQSVSSGGSSGNNKIGFIAKSLVEIQVVNDLLKEHLHNHGVETMNDKKHLQQQKQNCRIDFMDELCRPIVERVQFHFLRQEHEKESTTGREEDGTNDQVLSTRIEKLPQWLFEYLRNDVLECSNDSTDKKQQDDDDGCGIGVYELVRDSVHPFISIIATNIAETLASSFSEEKEYAEDNSDNAMMINGAAPWYYNEATAYLLQEVVYLCRHVFRSRRFFRHPMIVGGNEHVASLNKKSYNPLHLCHGIEQILLFDHFIFNLLNGTGGGEEESGSRNQFQQQQQRQNQNIITPPRLLDVFITSNSDLFQMWMDIDREYVMSTLVSASSSLSSSTPSDGGEDSLNGFDIGGIHFSPSFMSPTAEVFITLVQSLHAKLDATANHTARREYIATVIIPVCTHFMDAMHETASTLRSLLVARRRSSSSTGGSVRGRTTILPADEDLKRNMLGWIEVIAGTHLAAVALLRDDDNMNHSDSVSDEDDDLSRVGRSIARLRDAMVDECASSIVETILMERAKLAGYLMRCPFVLSSHGGDGGVCTGVDGHRTVSPDLIESIQILSVVVPICDKVSEKMKSTIYDEDDTDENEDDVDRYNHHRVMELIRHCPQSIKSGLAERLEEKMLEVALDVHGMTPEIGWMGAKQFCHDIFELARVFGVDRRGPSTKLPLPLKQSSSKGKYFDRLLDAVSLMAMEKAKFGSLREVLHGLARPDGMGMDGDNSFNDGVDIIGSQPLIMHFEDFNADGTLLDEAQSMLSAKGLVFLGLEDAISIMNRRKV